MNWLFVFAVAGANCLPPAIDQRPELPKFQNGKSGRSEFIATMAPLAVHIQSLTGYPASITLAKLLLETGGGTSPLAVEKMNFAGLSCGYTESKPDPLVKKPADADDCWKAPSAPELAQPIPEEKWNVMTLDPSVWGGEKGLQITERCSTRRRTRTQVVNGETKVFFEGGRYREFNHPFDSVVMSAARVLENPHYNDPQASHLSGKTLGEKFKEWEVQGGVRDSMNRFRTSKDPAIKAKAKRDILRILAGVYAPSRRDCKCCPESNEAYDEKLVKLMKTYELEKYDGFTTCSTGGAAGGGKESGQGLIKSKSAVK